MRPALVLGAAGVATLTAGPAQEAGAAGVAIRFDLNPVTPWTANGSDTQYIRKLLPDDWQLVSSPCCG